MLNDLLVANRDTLILVARVLLMTLFAITGWQKLADFREQLRI